MGTYGLVFMYRTDRRFWRDPAVERLVVILAVRADKGLRDRRTGNSWRQVASGGECRRDQVLPAWLAQRGFIVLCRQVDRCATEALR
jgi:hypothetical protein